MASYHPAAVLRLSDRHRCVARGRPRFSSEHNRQKCTDLQYATSRYCGISASWSSLAKVGVGGGSSRGVQRYLRVVVLPSFKGFVYEAHAEVSLEPGGRRRARLLHRRRFLSDHRNTKQQQQQQISLQILNNSITVELNPALPSIQFIFAPWVTVPVRFRFPVLPLPLLMLSVGLSLLLSVRVPVSPPLVFPVRLLFTSRSVFLSLFFTFSLFLLLLLLVGFAEAAWRTERLSKTIAVSSDCLSCKFRHASA